MNPFQKAADWIRSRTTPAWLKWLLDILKGIVVDVVKIIGKEAMQFLQTEIMMVAKLDMTGTEKARYVADSFRARYTMATVTDSMLNLAIELLVAQLKKSQV